MSVCVDVSVCVLFAGMLHYLYTQKPPISQGLAVHVVGHVTNTLSLGVCLVSCARSLLSGLGFRTVTGRGHLLVPLVLVWFRYLLVSLALFGCLCL